MILLFDYGDGNKVYANPDEILAIKTSQVEGKFAIIVKFKEGLIESGTWRKRNARDAALDSIISRINSSSITFKTQYYAKEK